MSDIVRCVMKIGLSIYEQRFHVRNGLGLAEGDHL